MRRKRMRGEERALIADHHVSRGWECSQDLLVDLGQAYGFENLVRTASVTGYLVSS